MKHLLTALLIYITASTNAFAQDTLKLTIKTRQGTGDVLIKLLPDLAPKHVERITTLVQEGAYNKVAFHRVIAGFMAQTGDVQYGNVDQYNDRLVGTGSSKYPDVPAEFSNKTYAVGVVGMARSNNPNSANSQFFITTKASPFLDGKYTVFGEVIEGMDVVMKIKQGNQRGGKVTNPDYIVSASLISEEKR